MFERSICLRVRSQLSRNVSGQKIAFVTEGFECCDAEVCDVIKDSFKYLRSADVTVEEISIPWHKKGRVAVLLQRSAVDLVSTIMYERTYVHTHQC